MSIDKLFAEEKERLAAEEIKQDARKARAGTTEKKTGASSKSSSAIIMNVMNILEPDVVADTDDDLAQAKPKAKRKARDLSAAMQPIRRPSGLEYYPRLLGEGKTDVETLKVCRNAGIFVMLGGYPGCGKTAVVEAAFGDELITVGGHGDIEVYDLVGNYAIKGVHPDTGNPILEWEDGPLTKAMKEGKVLFVDDTTLIPAQVLLQLYPAMDGRRRIKLTMKDGEEVVAKDGFFVCGAHNPGAPGAVFSEALASRFSLQIEVCTDLKMAERLGVDGRMIEAGYALRKLRDKEEITWAPEMRELLAFAKIADELGTDMAAANLVTCAPEECRDEVARTMKVWFPRIKPLRLAES